MYIKINFQIKSIMKKIVDAFKARLIDKIPLWNAIVLALLDFGELILDLNKK